MFNGSAAANAPLMGFTLSNTAPQQAASNLSTDPAAKRLKFDPSASANTTLKLETSTSAQIASNTISASRLESANAAATAAADARRLQLLEALTQGAQHTFQNGALPAAGQDFSTDMRLAQALLAYGSNLRAAQAPLVTNDWQGQPMMLPMGMKPEVHAGMMFPGQFQAQPFDFAQTTMHPQMLPYPSNDGSSAALAAAAAASVRAVPATEVTRSDAMPAVEPTRGVRIATTTVGKRKSPVTDAMAVAEPVARASSTSSMVSVQAIEISGHRMGLDDRDSSSASTTPTISAVDRPRNPAERRLVRKLKHREIESNRRNRLKLHFDELKTVVAGAAPDLMMRPDDQSNKDGLFHQDDVLVAAIQLIKRYRDQLDTRKSK